MVRVCSYTLSFTFLLHSFADGRKRTLTLFPTCSGVHLWAGAELCEQQVVSCTCPSISSQSGLSQLGDGQVNSQSIHAISHDPTLVHPHLWIPLRIKDCLVLLSMYLIYIHLNSHWREGVKSSQPSQCYTPWRTDVRDELFLSARHDGSCSPKACDGRDYGFFMRSFNVII